jgi:hypothetical protein
VQSTVQPQLIAGESWTQIADSLRQPKTLSAQAIGGTAEVLTAELCDATKGHPRSVCSAPLVKQYHAALPFLNGRGGGCTGPQIKIAGGRLRDRQPPRARTARCHTGASDL